MLTNPTRRIDLSTNVSEVLQSASNVNAETAARLPARCIEEPFNGDAGLDSSTLPSNLLLDSRTLERCESEDLQSALRHFLESALQRLSEDDSAMALHPRELAEVPVAISHLDTEVEDNRELLLELLGSRSGVVNLRFSEVVLEKLAPHVAEQRVVRALTKFAAAHEGKCELSSYFERVVSRSREIVQQNDGSVS